MNHTPVLLILWKRPEKTKQLILALKKIKPANVYVSCDGPLPNDSINQRLVLETRQSVQSSIDWECTVHTRYSDKNLGCKEGVVTAINWFFSHVECGIILEDDCIPSESFFHFATNLLSHYENDLRIWNISASNHQNSIIRGDGSYYFSRVPLIWGWATWKSRWKLYDKDLISLPNLCTTSHKRTLFASKSESSYWFDSWKKIQGGKLDTWDYQWVYTCLVNSGLTIVPNCNLVKNIGFDQEATHTKNSIKTADIGQISLPLHHPTFLVPDKDADQYQFKHHYKSPNSFLSVNFFVYKLKTLFSRPAYYPRKLLNQVL